MPGADTGRYHRNFVIALRTRPLPVTPASPACGRFLRLATVSILLVVLVTLSCFGASPASARAAQDPGVSTTTPVDSPTTAASGGPGSTEAPTSTTEPAAGGGSRRVADENRKIWVVVAGLIGVAVALSLLTFRYWRQTRPVPHAAPAAGAAGADGAAGAVADDTPGRRGRPPQAGRHSRRAVAGADHPAADDTWEPRGTGEHERVEVPPAERRFRLTRAQRAMAYRSRRPS